MSPDDIDGKHVLSTFKKLLHDDNQGEGIKISTIVQTMQSEGMTADKAVAIIQDLLFDKKLELTRLYLVRLPS